MRTAFRHTASLLVAALSSCAFPVPAFAKGAAVAPAAAPSVSAAPSAPAPAPLAPEAPALAVALPSKRPDERDPVDALVDDWFAKHFHGLGAQLDEPLYNRIHAAKEELKALLRATGLFT